MKSLLELFRLFRILSRKLRVIIFSITETVAAMKFMKDNHLIALFVMKSTENSGRVSNATADTDYKTDFMLQHFISALCCG